MKTYAEDDWVKDNLSGYSDGWAYLVTYGINLKALRSGEFKRLLTEYKKLHDKLEGMLVKMGYEAG